MLTLYVYYKLPAAEHASWFTRVQQFLDAARSRWPSTTVELLRRPAASAEGLETWMEVWREPTGVPATRAAELAELARQHDLPFPRASEFFAPCIPVPIDRC